MSGRRAVRMIVDVEFTDESDAWVEALTVKTAEAVLTAFPSAVVHEISFKDGVLP